ncbi:Uncharacterised protein [Mycobacterium tuberculosis]|nr:Uncharacterised protein [Mycobacterium tuberculosis]
MGEGLSNQAIGRRLFLSESAIGEYTTSMFGRLGRVRAYLNKAWRGLGGCTQLG